MRIRSLISIVAILIIAGVAGLYLHRSGGDQKYFERLTAIAGDEKSAQKNGPDHSTLQSNILERLKVLETPDSLIKFRISQKDGAVYISAKIPRGKPVEWIIWRLSSVIAGTSYHIEDCECPGGSDQACTLLFSAAGSKKPPVTLTIQWATRYNTKSSKMAVLIKDFRFAADETINNYLQFPEPLTFSLVPSRKLAAWTAQISNEYKKEVVVLLPMEPISLKTNAYRSSLIMVHYPEDKLRRIIDEAAESVPGFAGFGNLSGVRVLEDSRVMAIVFSEFKKKRGYFIEESVTRKTVAPAIAAKAGVPFATIDFSIDSTLKTQQIQELLRRYAMESQKRGNFIICSRATRQFIHALTDELPMLRKNGISLSYISDLVFTENQK